MDKRYCRDCRHDNKGGCICNASPNINEYTGYIDWVLKSKRNVFGKCDYYKRKWWKVWGKNG